MKLKTGFFSSYATLLVWVFGGLACWIAIVGGSCWIVGKLARWVLS